MVHRAREILHTLDIPFDHEVARVVADVTQELEHVDVNVALSASEDGWSEDDAVAYHRRWSLSTEERARRAIAFDTHPMWSIYVPTMLGSPVFQTRGPGK